MSYEQWVKDVFVEHQNCLGMDCEEAEEIYEETDFHKIEKWLQKRGYDLKGDYESSMKF